jgi:peptidoglycan-associated lipoprotein
MRGRLPIAAGLALAALAGTASAQVRWPRLPVIFPLGQSQPARPAAPGAALPATAPPAALQGMLAAAAGSDTVFFSARGFSLDANAVATLRAQARWLLANPMVRVRLEGHGDATDTRDYALAIGERRAAAVRDFLILQGIAPTRMSLLSWGKERPGAIRIGTSVVAAGPRVVTVVQ